jgi:hypothetical protein
VLDALLDAGAGIDAPGALNRLAARFTAEAPPDPDEVTRGFWSACGGGHRPAAAGLRERGADRDWVGYDELTPLDAAARCSDSASADDLGDAQHDQGPPLRCGLPHRRERSGVERHEISRCGAPYQGAAE